MSWWKKEEKSNVLIVIKSSFLQLTINGWKRLRNDCVIPMNVKIFEHNIDYLMVMTGNI